MATIDARVRNRLSKCLATKLSLLKLSLDVRIALGSLECIDAVLKLRKRYRLYPSWLDDWPIFDARLSGGHLWVKRVLLRPLGRDPSSRAEDE